jgi:hypothetical protein
MFTPSEVVQRFVDNAVARNVEGVVHCFSQDAVISQNGVTILASGRDEIGKMYERMFIAQPDTEIEVKNRIEIGTVVVDQEHVKGSQVDGVATAWDMVFVYRVQDGFIIGMFWFTP